MSVAASSSPASVIHCCVAAVCLPGVNQSTNSSELGDCTVPPSSLLALNLQQQLSFIPSSFQLLLMMSLLSVLAATTVSGSVIAAAATLESDR